MRGRPCSRPTTVLRAGPAPLTLCQALIVFLEALIWSTDTLWFDAAVVLGIFAVGNILFGHFEAHRAKWRRVLKIPVFLAIARIVAGVGRIWAYAFLGAMFVAAAYVHGIWLPRHGINGWTGEPRDRYLALVTKPRRSTPRP